MQRYKDGYRVQIRDYKGDVVSKIFSKKEDAQEFEENIRRERRRARGGLERPLEEITFKEYIVGPVGWLTRQEKRSDYAHSSFVADESKLGNYWLEEFGPKILAEIKTEEILLHLDKIALKNDFAPATRNRHRALLHTIFADALARGKVKYNPVSAIPLVEEIRAKPRINLKSDEQFEAFAAAMTAQDVVYGIIAEIQGGTGARICTANALQWHDLGVDETGNDIVMLRRIEERAGGSKIVERIKGKKSTQDIEDAHIVPLTARLKDVLERWRKVSRFTAPTDFIAANQKTGGYIPYDTLKDVIKRAVAKAEIPPITSHAVRRYYATALKRAGFSRAEIRELGGWSSEQMVARYDIKDVSHLAARIKETGFGAKPRKTRLKAVK